MKSLELKMQHTQLAGHFDNIVCSHDYGLPKEVPEFWQRLNDNFPYIPATTLLVDDSLPVLRSARSYGIAHLLAVFTPDSRVPQKKDVAEFNAINSFDDIMP
jgi:putative hydrolase of the HAD superfamily